MLHHLKKMFRNQRWILLMLSIFGFLFHLIFTAILSTTEVRSFANEIYKIIPPVFRSMAGFGDSASLISGRLIAFGYNHPASLLMLMFIPISAASRYITAEIENKTVDILLIRLYPRSRLVTDTLIFCITGQVILYVFMVIGTFTGRFVFGLQEEFSMLPVLKIMGIGILFYTAVSVIVIFIAVNRSERGGTLSVSVGFFLFFYVIDAIARIWDKAAFLKPYSLFNYYRPGEIAGGQYNFVNSIYILAIIIIIFFGIALYIFHHRDL